LAAGACQNPSDDSIGVEKGRSRTKVQSASRAGSRNAHNGISRVPLGGALPGCKIQFISSPTENVGKLQNTAKTPPVEDAPKTCNILYFPLL
jgi:hypothetical protein